METTSKKVLLSYYESYNLFDRIQRFYFNSKNIKSCLKNLQIKIFQSNYLKMILKFKSEKQFAKIILFSKILTLLQ